MDEAVLQNEEENEEILQYYSSNPHEPLKGCDCNLGFDDDYMYVWSGSGWGYSIIEYLSYPLWIWRYNLLTRRWSYCNVLDWPDDRKVPLGSENCTYASNEGFYLFLDIERNESAQYHFYICTKSQESTTFQCEPVEYISVGSNSKVDVDDRRYHFEFPMMCLDSDHFYFVRRGRTTQNYESFSCLDIYELRRMTKEGAWQWECISTNEAGDNLTYGDYKYIHDFLQSSSAFSLNLWHRFAFLFNKNVAVINCAPLDEDEMQISIQKVILYFEQKKKTIQIPLNQV
ncbi:hypothetical protein Ddc_04441 [Ditylenchus destructor]|nr:hypothetical protein Ddc_04441 [Ditylenchus destructor]